MKKKNQPFAVTRSEEEGMGAQFWRREIACAKPKSESPSVRYDTNIRSAISPVDECDFARRNDKKRRVSAVFASVFLGVE